MILRPLTVAALAAAALLPPAASAAPSFGVHAIFTGGESRSTYHVGEVLYADVHTVDGAKITTICWDPAPIARPACSASRVGAPARTGTQRLTLRLSDGTLLRHEARIVRAATHVDARPLRAVSATVTCQDATLFGNLDRSTDHLRDPGGTVRRGDRVALYNRLGPRAIFTWDYRTNRAGFALASCAKDDAPAPDRRGS